MPQSPKEQDRRAALGALADTHRVALPLNDVQAAWLDELVPFLATIPARMHGGLIRYVLAGVVPGDFLQAVLANDLLDSVGRADDENLPILDRYVLLLKMAAPAACFRSRERVAAWAAHRGLASPEPTCTVPPPGWACSRSPGHDGPCSAEWTAGRTADAAVAG